MAWIGEPKRHTEAAHKAWRTRRKNLKAEAERRAAITAKARATRRRNQTQITLSA